MQGCLGRPRGSRSLSRGRRVGRCRRPGGCRRPHRGRRLERRLERLLGRLLLKVHRRHGHCTHGDAHARAGGMGSGAGAGRLKRVPCLSGFRFCRRRYRRVGGCRGRRAWTGGRGRKLMRCRGVERAGYRRGPCGSACDWAGRGRRSGLGGRRRARFEAQGRQSWIIRADGVGRTGCDGKGDSARCARLARRHRR